VLITQSCIMWSSWYINLNYIHLLCSCRLQSYNENHVHLKLSVISCCNCMHDENCFCIWSIILYSNLTIVLIWMKCRAVFVYNKIIVIIIVISGYSVIGYFLPIYFLVNVCATSRRRISLYSAIPGRWPKNDTLKIVFLSHTIIIIENISWTNAYIIHYVIPYHCSYTVVSIDCKNVFAWKIYLITINNKRSNLFLFLKFT